MGNKKSTPVEKSAEAKDLSQVLSITSKLDKKGVVCTQVEQKTQKALGTFGTEIEWRIKKFKSLCGAHEEGMSLSSEGASSVLDPRPVWKLELYPNKKGQGGCCTVRVSLCLRGQTMDEKEILDATFRLYFDTFSHKFPVEKWATNNKFGKGGYPSGVKYRQNPDGSLAVVAHVEFVSKPLLSKLRCTADKLRESGGHNDCTLMVGDEEFKAHRAILSALSPIFEAMLQPYEVATVRVDYSAKTVKALLDFAYTGFVDWARYGDCKEEVLAMASHYCVTELKRQAEEQLVSDITPETLTDLIVLADSNVCGLLKKACARYLVANYPSVLRTSQWAELMRTRGELAAEMLDLMCACYASDEKRA